MARNQYSGAKRRRELDKKKKKEQKRQEKAQRSETGEEDKSYLEYLTPGGPQDLRFTEEEESTEDEDEDSED